ncbi:PIN domain-containing protein [Nesterenkonia alba]|uniref:PIN domain-containing protein n=1 Tax=Nesterenkonia alba TaxID=515814 RepID=UPI0003B682AD|nr:PIN domain-containing protein [Nesterenkonia alba]
MTQGEQPIVLDTNVVSELARPRPDPEVVSFLRRISHRTLITTVVLGEIYLGVELTHEGRRKAELRRHADSVRDAYRQRTIPFTAAAAQHYAASVAHLRAQGLKMSVNDAYIAASTVTSNASLATLNVKDFEHYPELELIDPRTGSGHLSG